MQTDNETLKLASKFINSTGKNIFLTGKAGTGKTTFLRNIVKSTHKKVVVAAPTGIAAINAGGVTLHSLFQLPFGIFIPTNDPIPSELIYSKISNPQSLLKELKLNSVKRKLIREMELLIIDEVSMLRADTLDAIDLTLRSVRRQRNRIFGGVQVLFIGDMQQLSPVVTNAEKPLLDKFYTSPYFFHAKAFSLDKPIYIELEKIYRQTDTNFINLLNHIRDNKLTPTDLNVLNSHFKPNFSAKDASGYVNLTTHNYLADQINQQELNKLKGKTFTYECNIWGDFDESAYPIEPKLELKEGAQVMFVKNDYSGLGRYFNGKIGKIKSLDDDTIQVEFDDGTPPAEAEPYTWHNKRYTLNKTTNEIEEVEIGTFTQFPLKLAWAITVHKSQGLTFQKAIIDVSRAFAPGQIYVALSRLTSLNGLVLTQSIPQNGLLVDSVLREFAQSKDDVPSLNIMLKQESLVYINDFVSNAFNLKPMYAQAYDHVESYDKDEKHSTKQQYKQWAIDYKNTLNQQVEVANKFQQQLQKMFSINGTEQLVAIKTRIEAAINYFDPIFIDLSEQINSHIIEVKTERGTKAYINELNELNSDIFSRRALMQKAMALIKSSMENSELTRDRITQSTVTAIQVGSKKPKIKNTKSEKGKTPKEEKISSLDVTLELAKQGHSVDEIAIARGLASSTILGHVVKLIQARKLEYSDYIDPVKYEQIAYVVSTIDEVSITNVKQKLGDEFTFEDVRIALAALQRNSK